MLCWYCSRFWNVIILIVYFEENVSSVDILKAFKWDLLNFIWLHCFLLQRASIVWSVFVLNEYRNILHENCAIQLHMLAFGKLLSRTIACMNVMDRANYSLVTKFISNSEHEFRNHSHIEIPYIRTLLCVWNCNFQYFQDCKFLATTEIHRRIWTRHKFKRNQFYRSVPWIQ